MVTFRQPMGNTVTPMDGYERFEVKKWNGVALWSWEVSIDNCAVCRNQIMTSCIECQANERLIVTDEYEIAWGSCNHAFHFHCISRWLKQREVCPLDDRQWEYQKIGNYSLL